MPELAVEVFASACSGATATILGHPLDCIKVRLQALQRKDLTTLGCAMELMRNEGPQAFMRGIGPPLVNAVIMNTVMFVAFEEARAACMWSDEKTIRMSISQSGCFCSSKGSPWSSGS